MNSCCPIKIILKPSIAVLFGFSSFFLSGCHHSKKHVHRGFYYWKTDFSLSAGEEKRLADLNIQKLYTRYFDVNINASGEAAPSAKIIFNSNLYRTSEIVPVVFITNNTLKLIDPGKIEPLARNIIDLINKTSELYKISFREVQFDCDWSLRTKEKYFALLGYARKDLSAKKIVLSCTIRLHQVKYYRKTGLPPVDRGMLMFYNMGEIADTTFNSIFNVMDAQKYTASIKNYPLPLDAAIAVFCWVKQYRDGHITGLLNNMKESDLINNDLFMPVSIHHFRSLKDGFFHGEYIRQEDLLIAEEVTPSLAEKAAELLSKNFPGENFTVVLYHWDNSNLSRYENKDVEDIYHRFD
jgi:hypothetical protein